MPRQAIWHHRHPAELIQPRTYVVRATPLSASHNRMMQQQMPGLVHHQVTEPSPRLRAAHALGTMICFSSGFHGRHHHRRRVGVVYVAHTGRARARLGRVTAAAAPPEYSRIRGAAAMAASESSRELLDQQFRPSHTVTVRKDKFFEMERKVRDEELDQYGVVNNAIYASYLHRGRDVLLEKLGFGVNYWTSKGNAMALSELNLKYLTPLRGGDRFVVMVKPVLIKGVRILVDHMIEALPDRKLVLEGRVTVVCLNKDFRPTRVFPELSARLKEVFSCKLS